MKKIIHRLFVMSLATSSLTTQAASGQGQGMGGHRSCQTTSEQVLTRTLSDKETSTLNLMREEEKMARDVYDTLYEQWNTRIFSNIAASEQRHMDKVKVFLDAYQLPEPASSETGKFNNQEIQGLYDQLLAQGSQSELEAFKAGAMVEEVDIHDLEIAIAETDNDELKLMYTQLMLASHNHLRAFSRQIINIEGGYVAQYLSSEAVMTILDDPKPEMSSGNAMLIDAMSGSSANNACFVGSINSDQGVLQNGSTIKNGDNITVAHKVTANSSDLNQMSDSLIIASFKAENSTKTQFFTRNGNNWQLWDGQINHLPSANNAQQLDGEYTLQIFQGQLQSMPGIFSIYSGYRLEDGSIVYNRFPTVFHVSE